ncbi:unnamed protein product [Effrenium voratum]|nr:unnamed protein product [Effrenium voratum]
MASKPKGAGPKSKAGRQLDHNWDCLSRDDIYRQRVLGTESGTTQFIKMDDKKQLSVLSMIVYIILIIAAMNFVWKEGVIESKFVVTQAVEQWISSRSYELSLGPKYFSDIDSLEDAEDWLLYALPVIIASPDQQQNFPLYGVRFSLRKVLEVNNTEPRFQNLAKVTWKDKVGIEASRRVSGSSGGYENDDFASFGAFREFGFNSPNAGYYLSGQASEEEVKNFSLGLQWCSEPYSTCSGQLIGTMALSATNASDAVDSCNFQCQQMERDGLLCYCWTLTSTECQFYHVPQELLVSTPPTAACWNHSDVVNVYPSLNTKTNGRTAYFPLMKRFVHTSQQPKAQSTYFADAYGGSQGFLSGLHYWTQDEMDTFTARKRNLSGVATNRPVSSSQGLLFAQLNDWMKGGFLGPTAGYLVVDWLNWNPNHEIVSWVVLKFQVEASGLVGCTRSINHLVIPESDVEVVRRDPGNMLWPGFNVWHAVYILLVGYLVCKELYDLALTGTKYFSSGWQLITGTGLLLHLAVIGLRYYHHSVSKFTESLATSGADSFTPDIAVFEQEAVAWSDFILASCFMMVFLFGSFVQYLSDQIPRIAVLVDTVSRSITPVFFLVIILCDVFLGFVIWCNLLFGKTVRDFTTIPNSAISLTEMIFGRLDVVEELRQAFPLTGFLFYLSFMVLFFFILQYLSRAIVLTSFDDASRSFEDKKKKRQAAKQGSVDQLTKLWKRQVAWAKQVFGLSSHHQKHLNFENLHANYQTQKWGLIPFTLFCAIYVTFVSMVLWVPESHAVVASLSHALRFPTFGKPNALSLDLDHDMSFDRIETREDVLIWLAGAFPSALYSSTEGGNELLNYAASPSYNQVVINDWNILLGQSPVRLSLQYDKMVQVSNGSVTTRFPVPQLIRSNAPATSSAEVVDDRARAVLEKYCGGYKEDVGFSCMLSVDKEVTIPTLKHMRLDPIATNQTRKLTADFVAYNGNIDSFFHVAVVFDFSPSGFIDKTINIGALKLPDVSTIWFLPRLFMEIAIIAFTVVRLVLCLRAFYRVALAAVRKSDAKNIRERLFVVCQVIVYYVLGNPFILFDFLSAISTVVTMVMWYMLVLKPLTQNFYFAETPIWTASQCSLTGLCSDEEAISIFAATSQQMRFFTQVCAANTIFLFLCYQKYLSAFPHGRLIAKTMLRGIADIACFLVVMVVLLMGYVAMGHTIFGTIMEDFSTLSYSVITCFQMFLGTFRSFEAMRQANSLAYYFYWYSYMVLFRYVLVNMFFAIIAKHFQEEDKEMEERMLEEWIGGCAEGCRTRELWARSERRTETSRLSFRSSVVSAARSSISSFMKRDHPAAMVEVDFEADVVPDPTEGDDASMTSPIASRGGGDTPMGSVAERLDEGVSQEISEPNWKLLPEDTRKWALERAEDIFSFIQEKSTQREELERKRKETYDIDRILEETEGKIQEMALMRAREAEKVKFDFGRRELRSLKGIHQDQESLAWYIMKREVELKKLEEAKLVKQDRYEKMVNATQSLIATQDLQVDPKESLGGCGAMEKVSFEIYKDVPFVNSAEGRCQRSLNIAHAANLLCRDGCGLMRRLLCQLAILAGGLPVDPPPTWRAAEEAEGLPVGAAVALAGDELIAGGRGVAFHKPSGRPFHIELVEEKDLPSFLVRRIPVYASHASAAEFRLSEETCRTGRFLVNDPRVGLFHNQRISYETALDMASALGRILVLPGFFKFPHPEPYAGTQWVPFRELFDLPTLRSCYGRVVELEELVNLCGPEVLENHTTVPFQTLWMRSKTKAPWINGTRPELVWAPPHGQAAPFRFKARPRARADVPLKLEESLGYILSAFLEEGVAEARTLRSHGLIAKNISMADVATCFLPSNATLAHARRVALQAGLLEGDPAPRVLGVHLRLFKASTTTSGGYLQTELQAMQESLCNLEPETFSFIASWTLARTFFGFWPTHTWMASNEADEGLLAQYMGGFPGPRANRYRPAHYVGSPVNQFCGFAPYADAAVTVEECVEALRSVLVDAIIAAWATHFIGNVCSTMSQYIQSLRLRFGKRFETGILLGGVQHADMLRWAREEVKQGFGPF